MNAILALLGRTHLWLDHRSALIVLRDHHPQLERLHAYNVLPDRTLQHLDPSVYLVLKTRFSLDLDQYCATIAPQDQFHQVQPQNALSTSSSTAV